MELYNRLHESMQANVHVQHFTHNVLPELLNAVMTSRRLCANCSYHGFPCLNCAVYVYNGELGPGFFYGMRSLFLQDIVDLGEKTFAKMLQFVIDHRCKAVQIKHNIYD